MSTHHNLAAALWLLAAFGAYILAGSWANDAQSGKLHPWVLLIVFWGAALASVAIHHLSLYLTKCLAQGSDAFMRYRAHYRRAARAVRLPYAQPLARTVDVAKAFQLLAQGRHAVLWGRAVASAAIQDLHHHLARAFTQLKRHWAEHTPAGGPARRGAYKMTSAPAMQMPAPARSQRSGARPSTNHSQARDAAM